MVQAWILKDKLDDQREENRCEPNIPITIEQLAELGIHVRVMDPVTMLEPTQDVKGEKLSELEVFVRQMGYKNRDEVCCCPEKLENYEQKLVSFFEEHIHEDEEIRLIKEGSGYFDVRAAPTKAIDTSLYTEQGPRLGTPAAYAAEQDDAKWIRILVVPGDLIIVPSGIYHRFTMDKKNFTHAIRIFSDAPRWVPLKKKDKDGNWNDATVTSPARVDYVRRYLLPKVTGTAAILRATPAGAEDGTLVRYVSDPAKQFDQEVKNAIRAMVAAERSTNKELTAAGKPYLPHVMVLYFTGVHYARTHQSWCPDCVVSDPLMAQQLNACRAALQEAKPDHEGVPAASVYFVHCPVERASYLKRPEHFYRNHPFVMLRAVPTVLVATPQSLTKPGATGHEEQNEGENAVNVIARYDGEVPPDWLQKALSAI